MAAYNTVSVKRLKACPRCADDGFIELQFAYGDTYQHHYRMGDVVVWGGNDVGIPAINEIEVIAYPEPCPVCGLDIEGEYVLTVENSVLTGYRIADAEDVARLELE